MKLFVDKKIIIALGIIVFSIFLSKTVFAVWSGTFYDPGETLNPECAPTDVDCDVLAPLTADNISDDVYDATSWNGVTTISASKNAIRDKIESLAASNHDPVTLGTANGLSLSTQILSLALASTSTTGALSSTDWNTFNGKESALTFGSGLTRTVNAIANNLITGLAGGQTIYGGTAANEDLTIEGTSNATKTSSYIILQPTTGSVGIGTVSPQVKLDVAASAAGSVLSVTNSSTGYAIYADGASYGVYSYMNDAAAGTAFHAELVGVNKKGLVLKAASGQAVNLMEAQNSSGTVMSSITSSGRIDVNTDTSYIRGYVPSSWSSGTFLSWVPGAGDRFNVSSDGAGYGAVTVTSSENNFTFRGANNRTTGIGILMPASAAGVTPLAVKAATSQSANLQEWQNSSGTALASITSSGQIRSDRAGSNFYAVTGNTNGAAYLVGNNYGSDRFSITANGGDAAWTDINASGSGAINIPLALNVGHGNTTRSATLHVIGTSLLAGTLTVTPSARTSGVASYFKIQTPADTTMTASTESIGMQFGGDSSAATVTRQWATGALTTQRENVFVAPTYSFAGASTLTTAATVAITGAPIAGTNATITNPYALFVQDGAVRFGALTNPPSPSTTQFTLGGTGNINFALQSNSDNDRYIHFNASNASVRAKLGFNVAANAFEIIGDNASLGQSLILSSNGEGIRIVSGGLVGVNKASSVGAQIHTVSGNASRIAGIFEGAASNSVAVLVAKSGSSGTGNLFEAQNSSGTALFTIGSGGALTAAPSARTSGSAAYLTVTAPADTTLAAATAAPGVSFVGATRQFTGGGTWADTGQSEISFGAPTYSASSAATIPIISNISVTNAVAGTNVTATTASAITLPNVNDRITWIGASGTAARTTMTKYTTNASWLLENYWSNSRISFIELYNSGLVIGSDTHRFMNQARTYEVMSMNGSGNVSINNGGTVDTTKILEVTSQSATKIGLQVNGAASNSAAVLVAKAGSSASGSLFEGQNSSGNAMFTLNREGVATFQNPGFGATLNMGVETSTDYISGYAAGTPFINTGNGATLIIAAAGTGVMSIDGKGAVSHFTSPRTSGSAAYFSINTPADTTLAASTEAVGVYIGGNGSGSTVSRQFATGALATQRERVFVAPTYAFVGASTLTKAINTEISSPIAGTNATLTNSIALQGVQSAAGHEIFRAQLAASPTGDAYTVYDSGGTKRFSVNHNEGGSGTRLNFNMNIAVVDNPAGALYLTSGGYSTDWYVLPGGSTSSPTIIAGRNNSPAAVQDVLQLQHFSGSAITGIGTLYKGRTSTTDRDMGRTVFGWSDGTDATRTSYFAIQTTNSGAALAEVARFNASGNLKLAGTATRGTTEGTNHLDIFDGTAPVGTLANGISLYSTSGELRVMDAAGNATLLSPHENTNNYWVFDSVNEETGKSLLIDMELAMKKINDTFGWDFVHEIGGDYERSTDPTIIETIATLELKINEVINFEEESTWRDGLVAWLGNVGNGIESLFADEVTTKELCVADDSGAKTCITKIQLDALLANTNSVVTTPAPQTTPTPEPEPAPEVTEEPEGEVEELETPSEPVEDTAPAEGEETL